jgi:TIR domain
VAHDAFISYASEDKAIADAACAALEQRKVRCWIAPRDVAPGADYAAAIVDAVRNAKLLVLIFSEHANASPHVRREVERAVSNGVAILPFRIQEVVPSPSLEYFISDSHWLDALTPPLEAHLDHLAETSAYLVDRSETPPSPGGQSRSRRGRAPALVGAFAAVLLLTAIVGWFVLVRDTGGGGMPPSTDPPSAAPSPQALAALIAEGPFTEALLEPLEAGELESAGIGDPSSAARVDATELQVKAPRSEFNGVFAHMEVYETTDEADERGTAQFDMAVDLYGDGLVAGDGESYCAAVDPDGWQCGGVSGLVYAEATLSPGSNANRPYATDLVSAMLRYADEKASVAAG